MSTLVGKLIALGLDDLAVKELRIIKRRLDGTAKPPGKIATKRNKRTDHTQDSSIVGAVQTLVNLLDFKVPPREGPRLGLAITTQLQVL